MRQLEADDQIVGGAVAFPMRVQQCLAQLRQIAFVFLANNQLIRIGPSLGADGHGFAAANQLGPALAESRPTPENILRRAAGARAIPAFHRLHGEAVADLFAVDGDRINRTAQRRAGACFNFILARQRQAEGGEMSAKIPGGFEGRNAD